LEDGEAIPPLHLFLLHIFLEVIKLAISRVGERQILMKKKFLIILFILFVAPYSFADEKRHTVPLLDSPASGPANAPVTIIEFLDYQ